MDASDAQLEFQGRDSNSRLVDTSLVVPKLKQVETPGVGEQKPQGLLH